MPGRRDYEWKGRRRSPDPALNDRQRVSSYRFSDGELQHAARDTHPSEVRGYTHGVRIDPPGWTVHQVIRGR